MNPKESFSLQLLTRTGSLRRVFKSQTTIFHNKRIQLLKNELILLFPEITVDRIAVFETGMGFVHFYMY